MDDALLVREVETGAEFRDDVDLLLERQGRLGAHAPGEVLAAQELHHDERRVVFLAEFEDRDDIAVLEFRGHPGLTVEARARRLVGGEVGRHDLDRHFSLEDRVAAEVHGAHPPRPTRSMTS